MKIAQWIAREWQRSDRLLYVLAFAITGGLTYAALELWATRLSVPLIYWGDALPTGAHFKTVIETGWYEYQPLLGAPFGQTYNDFPTADNLHFMAAKVLSLFTSDWAVAMNVYFLLGFPLAAMAAVWLLRQLNISRTFSLVLGVLYALAPYHFLRGEAHLWLASYYVVPFAVGLVIRAIRGQKLWELRASGPRWLRWASARTLGTLAIIALTGTAQSYYAVFFLILLAFSGVVRLIRTGQWRRFWDAAAVGGATVLVLAANMSPDVIYTLLNGENPGGFARGHIEAEIYALKLSQLLLPWGGHRIGFLRFIREQYDANYPLLSEQPALGATAALGLVALFLVLAFIAATWGGSRARRVTATPQFRLLAQLASLTFVAFIFSTIGGLSTLISFVTASIRGWNRMSIVIAILCLAAIGILADAAVRWLQLRVKGTVAKRAIAFGLAGVMLAGGYIDQTPANASAPYAETAERFDADRAWIGSVEASVPTGSMILQLPYQPFPESLGPTGISGSEALIPYLHSDQLRWSAGGIKGRTRADWPGTLERQDPALIARLAATAGFAGIHVDRASLTDPDRAALESALRASAGSPMVSADGRYAFYSLETVRAELEQTFDLDELADIGDRVVDPVTVGLASFGTRFNDDDSLEFPSLSLTPYITLTNDRDSAVSIELQMSFRTEDVRARTLVLSLPDGTTRTETFRNGTASFILNLDVVPGMHQIAMTLPGPEEGLAAGLVITSYVATEDAVAAFLTR